MSDVMEQLDAKEQLDANEQPTDNQQPEMIEILPVSLLDENRLTVEALKQLAGSLGLEFGWHYLLDLTWIIQRLGQAAGKFILDAGAGTGMLQWYLASMGAEVLSVDRGSRTDLPVRFRRRFNVVGLRQEPTPDLTPTNQMLIANLNKPRKLLKQATELVSSGPNWENSGRVILYNQDLKNLSDILDNTLDAVVSVSALEHNPPQDLPLVLAELIRVLKPGGVLLATMCAGRDQDWYHEASAGWCYTDTTLRQAFGLPESTPSNYSEYDRLFAELKNCAELRDNLASFYSRSGDNGMPWGLWDPQYQPVGICKVKS